MLFYYSIIHLIALWISKSYSFEAYQFVDLDFHDINNRLFALNGSFAHISTANYLLGVDLASIRGISCSPVIARISHMASLQDDKSRPQMIISGEIHGDERVGPLVSLYVAQVLVWSAECMINGDNEHCSRLLDHQQLTWEQIRWLTMLVMRRDIFIIPTANCLGYIENKRVDGMIDPNRDFPYGRRSKACMKSSVAHLFDKLMKSTLTQVFITFHGGMVAVGYEWGSTNHLAPSDRSPDNNCNSQIGELITKYAATFPGEKIYPIGRINSLVYPVEGGMEDWLYAAGWDKENLKICDNMSNDDIMSSNNRAIVYLVETSDMKKPHQSTLGFAVNVLLSNTANDGHIPRNTRLSLAAIDSIEPYICFENVDMYHDNHSISVAWRSSGAMKIDASFIAWHHVTSNTFTSRHAYLSYLQTPSSIPISSKSNPNLRANVTFQSQSQQLPSNFIGYATNLCEDASIDNNDKNSLSMRECLSYVRSSNNAKSVEDIVNLPIHQAIVTSQYHTISSKNYQHLQPGLYFLVVWEAYDGNWMDHGQGQPSNMPPQSHLANARANSNYMAEVKSNLSNFTDHRIIQGRNLWPSDHILVEVHDNHEMTIISYIHECMIWNRTYYVDKKSNISSNIATPKDRVPVSDGSMLRTDATLSGEYMIQIFMYGVVSFLIIGYSCIRYKKWSVLVHR